MHKESMLLGSYRVQAYWCLAKANSFHKYFSRILAYGIENPLHKTELLQINYFETPLSRHVLDLLVFLSYWDGYTLSQMSFLEMFTSQTTIAYCFFAHCYSRYVHYVTISFQATLLWMLFDRPTFWALWVFMCNLLLLNMDIP